MAPSLLHVTIKTNSNGDGASSVGTRGVIKPVIHQILQWQDLNLLLIVSVFLNIWNHKARRELRKLLKQPSQCGRISFTLQSNMHPFYFGNSSNQLQMVLKAIKTWMIFVLENLYKYRNFWKRRVSWWLFSIWWCSWPAPATLDRFSFPWKITEAGRQNLL